MTSYNKMNITDVSLSGKRILMRVEFNIPMEDGIILDTRKIDETIPTIEYALHHNARSIVLISHLGRPNGVRVPELSLKPIQPYLEEKLNREVVFIDDCISDEAIAFCNNPPHGTIYLLENLRYYVEETQLDILNQPIPPSFPIISDNNINNNISNNNNLPNINNSSNKNVLLDDKALSNIINDDLTNKVTQNIFHPTNDANTTTPTNTPTTTPTTNNNNININTNSDDNKISHITRNDPELSISEKVKLFCHKLSLLGDIYIDDAFATIHRNHSSLTGLEINTKVSGLLLSKELQLLSKIVDPSSKPLLGIIGGDNIIDNISTLYALLDKVDELIIYGDMSYTFIKNLNGINIGATPYDEQGGLLVNKLLLTAQSKGVTLHFPNDCIISEVPLSDTNYTKIISLYKNIPNNYRICDIGPDTIDYFKNIINGSKSVIVYGCPGLYKYLPFKKGSEEIIKSIDKQTKSGNITIGFGSATDTMFKKLSATDSLTLLSTGKGAVTHLLTGRTTPAIAVLNDKPNLDTLLMMYMFF